MANLDTFIITFDNGLRSLFASVRSARSHPDAATPDAELSVEEKELAVALMRVNHSGEICAQALYQGQALTARSPEARTTLRAAAAEETDHLAWTAQRIEELGGRLSALNPLWYTGSFLMGVAAGLLGDPWNLGFLAETERQVEGHLDGHLSQLPLRDAKSRAIVEQMKADEGRHAQSAVTHGAVELSTPIKVLMRAASRIMTKTTFRI